MRTRPTNHAAVAALALSLSAAAGCDYQVEGEHRLTSLRLSMKSPTESELGTPNKSVRLTTAQFDLEALDEHGQLMPVDRPVEAFLAAGGGRLSLTNPCSSTPTGEDPVWLLRRVDLKGGKATDVTLPLDGPAVFGRLSLNFEDPQSLAGGATPPIYFPNPTISQLMKPLDLGAANATFCSPYLNRQVIIDAATPRPDGKASRLVVSSLFANGLAVSDPGTPEFGSLYVFTFSQPSSQIKRGRIVTRMAGAIAKFNGMTQLANPTITASSDFDASLVPSPIELDKTRLPGTKTNDASSKFLTQYIAAPVRVTGIVCEVELDTNRRDNWNKYNSVSINQVDSDPKSKFGCGGVNETDYVAPTRFSVQFPGKGFGGFDPLKIAGQEATLTGMLQNSVSKSGRTLYWTVVIRDTDDVCVGPRAGCKN